MCLFSVVRGYTIGFHIVRSVCKRIFAVDLVFYMYTFVELNFKQYIGATDAGSTTFNLIATITE